MRMEHGLQGRVRQQQHGPGDICINRTLIKKRLLVEFSCEIPTQYSNLRFIDCAIIYHWISGHHNSQKQLTQTIRYQYIRQTILYRVLYRVLLCKPYTRFFLLSSTKGLKFIIPDSLSISQTAQESWLMSTFVSHRFIFHSKKTSLIIRTSFSFRSFLTMFVHLS